MAIESSLDIFGYHGRQVPNTFVRQEVHASSLAIFLPGFGYSCDMPLFYYAELLLAAAGVDVLRVEYAYNRTPDYLELKAAEQRAWLLADVTAALLAGLKQRAYQQLIVIGKSVGTRAMGHILTAETLPPVSRAVWLTPLLHDPLLREQLRSIVTPSLAVIGTADEHYDPTYIQELQETHGYVTTIIAGANHSLDITGDVLGSVRALSGTLEAVAEFLNLAM